MSPRLRASLLGSIAALSVVATIVGQALTVPVSFDASAAIVFIPTVASFAGVGAFLAFRVPGNRIGWLLLTAGVMFAIENLCAGYSSANVHGGVTGLPTAIAAWLANSLFIAPIVIVAAGVPLVYPDGHLPSPRWRWLAWLLVIGTVAATLSTGLAPGPINEVAALQNPFGVAALAPYLPVANVVATLSAIPGFVGAFAAVATRYRRGTATERQQIKWLLAVALVAAVAFPTAFIAGALEPGEVIGNVAIIIGFVALAALPVAIGIAILRYRLYEIDRVISRTIGWALVTAILVAVFAGLVVALQALLAPLTEENTLAVAASTLVAFALFQPLRRRVQHVVDRRFDRSRYDGERVVGTFAGRLRDEVDLGNLQGEIARVARDTVRPSSTAVWLRNVRSDRSAQVS